MVVDKRGGDLKLEKQVWSSRFKSKPRYIPTCIDRLSVFL